MANLLSFGLNIIADVFYPKYCFGCQRGGSYLCKFCMSQIPALAKTVCVVCNKQSKNGFTHPECKTNLAPDRLLSAFPYQYSTVSEMIITGKYYFIPEAFAVLGALAADRLFALPHDNSPPPELSGFYICAIPLHPTKQRWRGFNQSEIIARTIAQGLHLQYLPILQRTKNTRTQKDLHAIARQTNMQNAFACPTPAPEKIILIDDVSTTGQTFLSASAALKQAGAQTVWCLSIAKD